MCTYPSVLTVTHLCAPRSSLRVIHRFMSSPPSPNPDKFYVLAGGAAGGTPGGAAGGSAGGAAGGAACGSAVGVAGSSVDGDASAPSSLSIAWTNSNAAVENAQAAYNRALQLKATADLDAAAASSEAAVLTATALSAATEAQQQADVSVAATALATEKNAASQVADAAASVARDTARQRVEIAEKSEAEAQACFVEWEALYASAEALAPTYDPAMSAALAVVSACDAKAERDAALQAESVADTRRSKRPRK